MIGCWIVQWQIWDYNWQSLIQISFMRLQIKVLSTRKHPRKQDTVFPFSYELSLHITARMEVSPTYSLKHCIAESYTADKAFKKAQRLSVDFTICIHQRIRDWDWQGSFILFKQVSGVIQVAWPYQPTMMGLKVSLETCTQRCRKCREEKTSWL